MNIIDISSWQSGIDLDRLFRENDLDGVIVKASEGTGYVNPDFASQTAWLSANGKPFGFYHYCDGADANAEAEHFYNTVRQYIGKGIPVVDYEGDALKCGTGWLKTFVDRFLTLSGARCMIYVSLSVIHSQDFSALTSCPLWIAQYADYAPVYGFLDKPWQSGSVSPFVGYYMHQYTSNGHLNGWDGNLDLDKFYWGLDDWNNLAHSSAPTHKAVDPVVVSDVLHGYYQTGETRRELLRSDGYDPDEVQAKVNELYGIAEKWKKEINGNFDYRNSVLYIVTVLEGK